MKNFKIVPKIKSVKILSIIDFMKSYREDFGKKSNKESVIELILNSEKFDAKLFDRVDDFFETLNSEFNFYKMFLSDLTENFQAEYLVDIQQLLYNIVKKSFKFDESVYDSFIKTFSIFIKESTK